MATANQMTRTAPASTGAGPARTARLVVWLFVLVNLVAVWAMFAGGDTGSNPAKNTLVAIGRFLGLHAALLMIAQLLLIARIGWLDRRIGMDRLTSWHRLVGLTLFWVVLIHPTFVILGYSNFYRLSFV